VDEFLAGLERLPVGLPELDLLFHGTTVGINTVLQERGARVGLVTTAGFRDVLALGRGSRPSCTTSSTAPGTASPAVSPPRSA
jgi:N-methylhydantoinase A